jgi:D-alanyl-D-alanine carboxypeptidase (penicillin-binding protein 5/6)
MNLRTLPALGLALLLAGGASAAPRPEAKSWLLVDYHSGQTLVEHAADERLEPASLTKLMTAWVVFQELRAGRLALTDPVLVSRKAQRTSGSRTHLREGERVAVQDLLQGMLIQSGNDAAVALAEHVAGSEEAFAARMNQEARALNLVNTRFVSASGLPRAGHYSSARDLTRLASALIREYPEHYHWYGQREFGHNGINQRNRNTLLWRSPEVDGLKTGYTRPAGHCLVSSATRQGMRLIATVLGATSEPRRNNLGQRLLEQGFEQYETRLLFRANDAAASARVWMGEADALPVGLNRDLYLTLPRGGHGRLTTAVAVSELEAPVALGQPAGTLRLLLDQKPYSEYTLVALRAVANGDAMRQTVDRLRKWLASS